jgi:hypothetical protein
VRDKYLARPFQWIAKLLILSYCLHQEAKAGVTDKALENDDAQQKPSLMMCSKSGNSCTPVPLMGAPEMVVQIKTLVSPPPCRYTHAEKPLQ